MVRPRARRGGCLDDAAQLHNSNSSAERQARRGHVPPALSRLDLQPVSRLPAANRLNQ